MYEKIANDLLSSEEVKSLQFEIFPKIHKDGNPGRQFKRLPYCKDFKIHWSPTTTACKRTQFVCKRLHRFHTQINSMDKIPDNSIFVTMDIPSICTNISNKEGIEAAETTVRRKNIGTKIISIFLHLFWTIKVASAAKIFFCHKECPWYVINDFFYLKKKCFVQNPQISKFVTISET